MTDPLDLLIDQAVVAALPRGKRGRVETPPTLLREITPEDFPYILRPESYTSPEAKPLQKLRQTHHLAARSLAEGRKVVEVAQITGYTPTRISMLQQDPSFKELVEHYKTEVNAAWINVQERLAALGLAVTEEFADRLADAPEKISNEELRRWAETIMDRAGLGPSKTVAVKSTNATLHLIEMIKDEVQGSPVKMLAAE